MDARDVGMVHEGQRLAFPPEARDERHGGHARANHFEGDVADYRLALMGAEDDAHASFAELFDNVVGAGAAIIFGRGGGVKEAFGRGLLLQQTFHFAADLRGAAGPIQIALALGGREFDRLEPDSFQFREVHQAPRFAVI